MSYLRHTHCRCSRIPLAFIARHRAEMEGWHRAKPCLSLEVGLGAGVGKEPTSSYTEPTHTELNAKNTKWRKKRSDNRF